MNVKRHVYLLTRTVVCYIMIAAQLRTINVYTDDGNLLSRVISWFFTKLKNRDPSDPFRTQQECRQVWLAVLQLYSDRAGHFANVRHCAEHFANRRDIYQLAKVVHENRSDKSL